MSQLKLHLLGTPRIELGGIPIKLNRRKAIALLIYLALTGQTHRRDALAALFWPDYDQASARGNLRRTLSVLNQALADHWLDIDRETIRLKQIDDLWVDAAQFQHLLAACESHDHPPAEVCPDCLSPLSQAVTLYTGDFLTGFTLSDSPDFDDWQLFQAESLRQEILDALGRLVQGYAAQQNFKAAIAFGRRWLAMDPLHEPAHRHLMQLYARADDRAGALRQYEECVRTFKQELDLPPSAETKQLYEAIVAGKIAAEQPPQRPTSPAPPPPTTPSDRTSTTSSKDELRLVSVLFVDMSRSVETTWDLQPEETAELINRLLKVMVEILLNYEARVDHFLGDGLLAVFGTPQAHEDDPERAIRAALAIRTAAQKLDFDITVGINTGTVYFGRMGSPAHREITVMGPMVNLASRLQGQAEVGQILVGESTYHQTRGIFSFRSHSLNLKGIPDPIRAYQVMRPRRRAEKLRGIEGLSADLIGRDEELAKLKNALQQVSRGQGQMVSLIGEAGIGKSRLVAELKQAAPQAPAVTLPHLLWLEGRCQEMNMAASYWPFIDIFRAYFAWKPEDSVQTRAESVASTLQSMAVQGYLPVEQVEEIGPLLGQLLSLRFGNDWDDRLRQAGPEQIRYRTLVALRDFFVSLTQQQPLILILEDLHWADSLSLELVSLLMESLPSVPLLLICIYRPERAHKCWQLATIASRKCPAHFAELRLRELTPVQSQQLAESLLLIEDLPASTKTLILEKSQGNPFFVEEISRALIDAQFIYQDGEIWRARTEIEALAVPERVQSIIQSRLDRLGPELKGVLQRAAVIGRLFRQRILAKIIPPEINLEETLAALEDEALIYQERAIPEVEYSFKHVLTQEAIYQTILRRQGSEFHRQVAAAMEDLYEDRLEEYFEQLAYHYDKSDAADKAIEYLLKAGHKSQRAYLNDEAIDYFRRVIKRCDESSLGESRVDSRLAALTELGRVYHRTGIFAQAETNYRQAIELEQETEFSTPELVRLYYWLADAENWQNRNEEGFRIGEAGLALLSDKAASTEAIESVEAAMLNQLWALGHLIEGNEAGFRTLTARTVPFIRRLPYEEELGSAYSIIATYYYLYDKKVEKAMAWFAAMERQARQHHDLRSAADAVLHRGAVLFHQGDYQEAISRSEQGLEVATKIGETSLEFWSLRLKTRALLGLGELQKAEEAMQRGIDLAEALGALDDLITAYRLMSMILLDQGRHEQAVDMIEKVTQRYQELPPNMWADILDWLGRAYLALGKRERALVWFQEALVRMEPDYRHHIFHWIHWRPCFAGTLSGLEETYQDPNAFHKFCDRYREEHPLVKHSLLVQLSLEPTPPDLRFRTLEFELNNSNLKSKVQHLKWHDPFEDCLFTTKNGLEIRAANGRDLWFINLSAPRLLRSAEGDFAVQTACSPVSDQKPAIGGILLWKNEENFLRLDRGVFGRQEILFSGSLANKDIVIGRGRLPLNELAERIFLRLERRGPQVNALCSSDGENWFSAGQVEFPVDDPLEIGLHAVGNIDRTIYQGAFPEGTAIHFESFQVWQ